ncbi:cilia- and flagella-associated protein 263 isoform X2 [Denticeps clupeoides]|uniref:Cilia- and flagella-associated protein 263 n=1 Tax=Denticeps clupeoides TaxID=299321 RepID=A0AAY4DKS5_9TELE|nr:coiled-coil domain-containing protein 113 isoform X2 [Denticeps clupeoides]
MDGFRKSNAALRAENVLFKNVLDAANWTKTSEVQNVSGCLNWEQKCHVAQFELENVKKEMETLDAFSEKHMVNNKAALKEAEIQLMKVKKARDDFNRDVAVVLHNRKGLKIDAEKARRYIKDQINLKKSQVEKLLQKNASLCMQRKKLQLQLRQKEEVSEDLQEMDFQQLQIGNRYYLESIDCHNQELLYLKVQAGNSQQILNTYKKKLQDVTSESVQLSTDISARRKMLLKTDEMVQVEEQQVEAEALNRNLRQRLADYSAPDVADYMSATDSRSQLEKAIRVWEHKVQTAEMVLKSNTKAWKLLCEAAGKTSNPYH